MNIPELCTEYKELGLTMSAIERKVHEAVQREIDKWDDNGGKLN